MEQLNILTLNADTTFKRDPEKKRNNNNIKFVSNHEEAMNLFEISVKNQMRYDLIIIASQTATIDANNTLCKEMRHLERIYDIPANEESKIFIAGSMESIIFLNLYLATNWLCSNKQ